MTLTLLYSINSHHKSVIIFVFVVASLLSTSRVVIADDGTCFKQVQGKIAWNYTNSKTWNPGNIRKLCKNAESSAEPARCFQRVMHGGSERWSWSEALDLCSGSTNHSATIACLRDQQRAGQERSKAIAACKSGARASANNNRDRAGLNSFMKLPAATGGVSKSNAQWWLSAATANNVNDVATDAASPSLENVAALTSFKLNFREDHKIRRIMTMADGRFAKFALNDKDGDDHFWANASWINFSSGSAHSISAAVQGQVELDLTAKPANHSFALQGFEFRRKDGTDANIRSLGIWYLPDTNKIRVWLIDDMGVDFRGLEETAATIFAGAFLPGAGAIGSTATSWDALSRFTAQGGPRPYQVTVQYVWLPNETVESGNQTAFGARPSGGRGRNPAGPHVLQGFDFSFGNSDHHLKELGVDLNGKDQIFFQDNNRDDPINWAVQYRELNTGSRR